MNWQKIIDFIFPYIESPTKKQLDTDKNNLDRDILEINKIKFYKEPERALNEAQRITVFNRERVKTAESKATAYLAVLAFSIPVIMTLQIAILEQKQSYAPQLLKFILLLLAAVYLITTALYALRTLKVSASYCVMEDGIVDAWRMSLPLQKLTKSTLLASRKSRKAVNDKVTLVKVAYAHLIRALIMLLLLMLLEPLCYIINSIFYMINSILPYVYMLKKFWGY